MCVPIACLKIARCTFGLQQCFLVLFLSIPALVKTDWTNVVWAFNQLLFFKAELSTFLVSLGLVVYHIISTHHQNSDMSTFCQVTYALQNVSAILCRLLFVTMMAYSFDNFGYVYIFVLAHLFMEYLVSLVADCKNWKEITSFTFILKGLINISTFHPEDDGKRTEHSMHFVMELVILVENLSIFWTLNVKSDYWVLLTVMWTFYFVSVLLKILFYFGMHPSSGQFYDEVKSMSERKKFRLGV